MEKFWKKSALSRPLHRHPVIRLVPPRAHPLPATACPTPGHSRDGSGPHANKKQKVLVYVFLIDITHNGQSPTHNSKRMTLTVQAATFKNIKSLQPLFDRVLVQRFKPETVSNGNARVLRFWRDGGATGHTERRQRALIRTLPTEDQ